MVALAWLPALALAGDDAAGNPASTSPALMLSQTLAGLLVVIALILGLAWLAKKFNVSAMGQGTDLRVLSSISLGTREKAVLIEVHGERLLLGVAPGRVTSLHRLPQVDIDSQASSEASECEPLTGKALSSDFASKLNQMLNFGNRV